MTELTGRIRLLLTLATITVLLAAFFRTPYIARLYYPYQYRQIIEDNAREFGVDPLLVAAVIHVESKYDPQAESRMGALGLMQIMPSTARWIAPQIGIENLTDEMLLEPAINIRLGTWYIASLYEEFNGRLDVVIAAYNGGRGQVARWLEEGRWSGTYKDRAAIPFPETRHFVYKVRKTYTRYRELYH